MPFQIDSEFQSLIPPLANEEVLQLRENLVTDGCREPLVIWTEENVLLDGHNRYAICTAENIPFEVVFKSFANREDATEWIIRNQFGRRNLPPYVRTQLALRLEEVFQVRAKLNQSAGGGDNRAGCQISDKAVVHVDTKKEIAKIAGVSHDTVAKVKKIEAHAPTETKAALLRGDITINQAHKDIVREQKRADHAAKVEQVRIAPKEETVSGPYSLVIADPPWRYDSQEAANRAIENHYPTATVAEIIEHSPETTKDAILFLWATAPKLVEAIEVLNGWGFEYKTHAVWDKEKVGMGYWFRGQHELLLVGVKGNPGATPEPARVSSIFRESRGRHSEKPDCVYQWIENAFPELTKLEMYCRTPREGWGAWGNEV